MRLDRHTTDILSRRACALLAMEQSCRIRHGYLAIMKNFSSSPNDLFMFRDYNVTPEMS